MADFYNFVQFNNSLTFSMLKKIKTALVSVYHKDNLDTVIRALNEHDIKIFSTGGTKDFIEKLGIECSSVESLTSYPSILGGRVKTLHPKVFGGILARRSQPEDLEQLGHYEIPEIDLVIVDLYPFASAVAGKMDETSTIELIDIGGISLIRAAAKNFNDVVIVSCRDQYADLLPILNERNAETTLSERKKFASEAFRVSSQYDTLIYNYFNQSLEGQFVQNIGPAITLRYGENPHQQGTFYGKLEDVFIKLSGKEISYNNLLDIDAAINLIAEFEDTTVAIIKHNNACGIASRENLADAWTDALSGDPVSAFGGVIVTNQVVDEKTAGEINKLFFEVILAPDYDQEAYSLLSQNKKRIILQLRSMQFGKKQFRSVLNGVLEQDRDVKSESRQDMEVVTDKTPSDQEYIDLEFANKIVKQTKSNAIVLVKNKQMLASGVGQTSRVDALKQAIEKATTFAFDLKGSVMASDAFFPFSDSVEIAHRAGVTAVIQPGGSIRDEDSVSYCNSNGVAMVFTGVRHFKH